MNEQSNNTNAAFMEITSQKLDTQDKKIHAVEEKIKNISTDSDLTRDLLSKMEELRKEVSVSLPVDKLTDFGKKLDNCIYLLAFPKESKVQHHHHVPKIIWIAAGLFIVMTLVCAGWFNTHSKLDEYIVNDSKYRYLKLDTANKKLQLYMSIVDSPCNTDNQFRFKIVTAEKLNRQNFERLQKAYQLKSEAQKLENEVEKK
jgi:hypothetical protein